MVSIESLIRWNSKTLGYVASLIKPGVTTLELDKSAETYIRDHGGVPTFKGYPNNFGTPFPATLCTSINDQIVHGIPSGAVTLKEGDIISVDCGVRLNGFCGDSAYTFGVGEINSNVKHLLKVTKQALLEGIDNAVVGKRIGDIGFAIQNLCENSGYGVVREFVGHGIGRNMHEDPQVPNYGKRGKGPMLQEGWVIAIEPMINLGTYQVRTLADKWTIITKDAKPSAHFEHTIAVKKGKADLLSDHNLIFEAVKKSEYIKDFR